METNESPQPTVEELRRIDAACEEFAGRLGGSEPPSIETYVAAWEGSPGGRQRLLIDLIDLEVAHLRAAGDAPSQAAYLARFPDEVEAIAAAFALPPASTMRQQGTRDGSPEPAATVQRSERDAAVSESTYRIERFHAEGGLGRVSLAWDDRLSRRVALKEIKPGQAGLPESRNRFRLEAEITGGLEHPAIVPVYCAGQFAEGQPFYTMPFIDGESLQNVIDRRREMSSADRYRGSGRREFRQLLQRLITVCQGVAYAHSRGVIHRDLKPANILMGPYGETFVIDWGLAKAGGTTEDPAVPGGPLKPPAQQRVLPSLDGLAKGTPAFMSPEQARGDQEQIDQSTDIYSLGALLYCVLTCQPPVPTSSAADALQDVAAGRFPPPREVDRQIPPVLQSICLRAMARSPHDRYASALSLAEDLENWLADEPVSAHRERLPERAARWSRRHRPAVRAAAALGLLALIVLLVANYRIRQEQQLADRQRQRADTNFQLAREAVDRFTTEVAESELLTNVHGLQPLQQELLSLARDYYQEFVRQESGDPAVRLELAGAHIRAGRIEYLLGNPQQALREYEEGLDILDGLPPDNALKAERLALGADALRGSGLVHLQQQRPRAARPFLLEAVRRRRQVAQVPGRPADNEAELAITFHDLARTFTEVADPRAALAAVESGLFWIRPVTEPGKEDGFALNVRAALENTQAAVYGLLDLTDRSIATYQQSITTAERLAKVEPDSPQHALTEALAYSNLGRQYARLAQLDAAGRQVQRSYTILEELARQNPLVVRYQHIFAEVSVNYAGMLFHDHDVEDAEHVAIAEDALAALERIPDWTRNAAYLQTAARARYHLGVVRARREQWEAALREFEAGKELLAAGVDATPLPEHRLQLARLEQETADTLTRMGREQEALDAWKRALAIQEELVAESPELGEFTADLMRSHGMLAELYRTLPGHETEALDHVRQSLEYAEELATRYPQVFNYTLNFSVVTGNYAGMLMDAGRLDESVETYDRSIEVLLPLELQAMVHVDVIHVLRNNFWGRANALELLERHGDAAEDWRAARIRTRRLTEGVDDLEEVGRAAAVRFRAHEAAARARAGELEASQELLEELQASDPSALNRFAWEVARAYAWTDAALRDEPAIDEETRGPLSEAYRNAALSHLRAAAAGDGLAEEDRLSQLREAEPPWDWLPDDPEGRAFLESLPDG